MFAFGHFSDETFRQFFVIFSNSLVFGGWNFFAFLRSTEPMQIKIVSIYPFRCFWASLALPIALSFSLARSVIQTNHQCVVTVCNFKTIVAGSFVLFVSPFYSFFTQYLHTNILLPFIYYWSIFRDWMCTITVFNCILHLDEQALYCSTVWLIELNWY